MKKNVLALSIATGLIQMYPKAHPILTQSSAGDLQFGNTGCGQTLLVPYWGAPRPWWTRASGVRSDDQYDFKELLR